MSEIHSTSRWNDFDVEKIKGFFHIVRQLIESSRDEGKIRKAMMNRCLLWDVPFNEMKHARNIDSVVDFLRHRAEGLATGEKHERE